MKSPLSGRDPCWGNIRTYLYDLWLEVLWAGKLALLIFVAVFAALMCWSWSARWLP